jgi:hypothetical protein
MRFVSLGLTSARGGRLELDLRLVRLDELEQVLRDVFHRLEEVPVALVEGPVTLGICDRLSSRVGEWSRLFNLDRTFRDVSRLRAPNAKQSVHDDRSILSRAIRKEQLETAVIYLALERLDRENNSLC